MNILCFDTATEVCSVALAVDDQLFTVSSDEPRAHGQRILGLVQELLTQAKLSMAQMDVLGFGQGPGSFTGLRIAAGVAQGLALAHDLPVVGVSTLQALAQQAFRTHQAENVLAILDARMQEVYWGHYQLDANQCMQAVAQDQLSSPNEVTVETGVSGIGKGWAVYKGELPSVAALDDAALPQAEDMIPAIKAKFAEGKTLAPEQALPVYLRNKVTR